MRGKACLARRSNDLRMLDVLLAKRWLLLIHIDNSGDTESWKGLQLLSNTALRNPGPLLPAVV